MSDATCKACKFYEASDSTCRINPPVRLPRKFESSATAGNRVREETLIWGWPAVDKYDWCGRWHSKRTPERAEDRYLSEGWIHYNDEEARP